jgi:hypothetical protein
VERLTVEQTIAHRVLPQCRIIVVKLALRIPAEESQLPRALEVKPGGDRGMCLVPGFSSQLSESTDCFQPVPGEHQGIDLNDTITGLTSFRRASDRRTTSFGPTEDWHARCFDGLFHVVRGINLNGDDRTPQSIRWGRRNLRNLDDLLLQLFHESQIEGRQEVVGGMARQAGRKDVVASEVSARSRSAAGHLSGEMSAACTGVDRIRAKTPTSMAAVSSNFATQVPLTRRIRRAGRPTQRVSTATQPEVSHCGRGPEPTTHE